MLRYEVVATLAALLASAPGAAEPPIVHVPALTVIELRIVDHVSSKLNHVGDQFRIEVAIPLKIEGRVVIPAGTSGVGEVVHAARARAAGKAGELVLTARYVDVGDKRVMLRSFSPGQSGKTYRDEALLAGMVAAPLMLLVSGGEVNVQPGTLFHAKLTTEADLPSSE